MRQVCSVVRTETSRQVDLQLCAPEPAPPSINCLTQCPLKDRLPALTALCTKDSAIHYKSQSTLCAKYICYVGIAPTKGGSEPAGAQLWAERV